MMSKKAEKYKAYMRIALAKIEYKRKNLDNKEQFIIAKYEALIKYENTITPQEQKTEE